MFKKFFAILLKKLNIAIHDENLRKTILQPIPFWIASLLSGCIAFLYYKIFSFAEQISFSIYEKNRVYIFFITPICFLLSWFLVKRFAPFSKGSGIPQVMAAIELSSANQKTLVKYLLGFKIALIKILSSAINLLGGGLIGREGPTIQISASVFVLVNKLLPDNFPKVARKNMIIVGAASGLAAAFNTPLGGIIFAIEELSKYHIRYYKSPLFVAVIIAGLVAQGLAGSYLYLGYPKVSVDYFWTIVGLFLVAIISGLLGAIMCKILLKIIQYIRKFHANWKQMIVVILSAMCVATIIYFFGKDAMGSGKNLMERLLFQEDKNVVWYIPFIRMFGMISSFSFGGAGGIFAPSLSCGASIGAVIADLMNIAGNNANVLILVGMTAYLTGVTRSPFTSAIIVFEMTDRHSIIFYLMLAALISNLIGNLIDKKSFYDYLKEEYVVNIERKIRRKHNKEVM